MGYILMDIMLIIKDDLLMTFFIWE